MPRLPRAPGDKHVRAFQRAGWRLYHIEGSHHILVKQGSDMHLSIPVHKGRDLGVGLLHKLIAKAGLTDDEYIELFYR